MLQTRRTLTWQLAIFAAALLFIAVIARTTGLVEWVAGLQETVMHWGKWSAVVYPFLFALCNILLLPGGILCVGSGFFFGLWWGFFIVFTGNCIGAAISFALSRWIGRRAIRRQLGRNRLLAALEPAIQREGWKIVFLTQLHPLFPTSLINYLCGLTKISFRTFMLWSAIGRAPGLFLYVYIGTLGQYGLNVARGKTHPRAIEYWTWGGAFVITALLLVVASRIAARAVAKSEEEAAAATTETSAGAGGEG